MSISGLTIGLIMLIKQLTQLRHMCQVDGTLISRISITTLTNSRVQLSIIMLRSKIIIFSGRFIKHTDKDFIAHACENKYNTVNDT
jgi:hypothetical protein